MIQVSVHKETGRVTALGHPPGANEIGLMIPRAVDVAFGWTYDERNRSFIPTAFENEPVIVPFKTKVLSFGSAVVNVLFGPKSPFDLLKERLRL